MNYSFNIRLLAALVLAGCLSGSKAGADEDFDRAPDLKVREWLNGKAIRFDAGDQEKFYVLEYYMQLSLDPRFKEDPFLLNAYKRFGSDRIVFVRIVDTPPNDVLKFLEKYPQHKFPRIAIDAEHQTLRALGAVGLPGRFPSFVVVDGRGVVVAVGEYQDAEGNWTNLETLLKRIVSGDFDTKIEARRCRAERLFAEFRLQGTTPDNGKKVLEYCVDNHDLFTRFTAFCVTGKSVLPTTRKFSLDNPVNGEFALAVAEQYAADKRTKPAIGLELYAKALYAVGRKPEALEKAIAALKSCDDENSKARLEKMREHFENNQP